MQITADTLDDLLRKIYARLLKNGKAIVASKGAAREEIGVMLRIKNPITRFSRSESRATLFSCIGETLWYLDGSSSLDRIQYYIPAYRKIIEVTPDQKNAPGAYGPRIFGSGVNNQIERIISTFKSSKSKQTRKAVVQIFDKSDLLVNQNENGNDVPCTISFQFFVRRNRLHLMCNMRSNDVYLGLPHDVFAFTFIQEYVARSIGVRVGEYIQSVGSLHLYEANVNDAKTFLDESWQDIVPMPEMPIGDPALGLAWLLAQESALRGGAMSLANSEAVDPYWVDLARILLLK